MLTISSALKTPLASTNEPHARSRDDRSDPSSLYQRASRAIEARKAKRYSGLTW
ncbi:hypothetical protein PGT21_023126 [Puccinia graminis f. sp. tritici]|uniref:Uncharacterized protein n=1 Tax=Puccinia graminis f. sp. tritici TaxID=56615 RepID=A0A5B0P6I8_PUCGR|nr:hypothetical protein PGT21_023126 [Puccinia graminis f. sp. tritici]KAA1131809.1 hypothetical protein PGTUg99_027218 [Puccinia graminis f. sp. tritici]